MDNYSCIKLQPRDLQQRCGTQTRDVVGVHEVISVFVHFEYMRDTAIRWNFIKY